MEDDEQNVDDEQMVDDERMVDDRHKFCRYEDSPCSSKQNPI